jgi:urease accessory protein
MATITGTTWITGTSTGTSMGSTATAMPQNEAPGAAQILAAWFSPAYPVGSYSYSHGLEWAVETGQVRGGDSLSAWIADLLEHGAGRNDAILLAEAFRAPDPAPVAELAEALAPTAERHLETMAQGAAFARTTAAVWDLALPPMPYPVAIGRAAALLGLPLDLCLTLHVQAFAAGIVSAGVRLIPLGQTEGQAITARLMPLAARVAAEAGRATLDDIGGFALRADLASMLHETQYTRIYRS